MGEGETSSRPFKIRPFLFLSDSFRENLRPVLRKELLKLVFKKLAIDHQRISSFELYEPFQSMYKKALAERRIKTCQQGKEKQTKTAMKSQSCLLGPSDGHWPRVYTRLCAILFKLYS
jgi:hypothetical protein